MEEVLDEIQTALEVGLFYAAVTLSLSLPDVCVALECEPSKIWCNEQKYKAWFDANLAHYFSHFNSQDCWALRGGVVHNAKFFGHKQARHDRLYFMLPNSPVRIGEYFSANNGGTDESALGMDAVIFCERMMQGVREWLAKQADNPNVQANLPNLVRLRPDGLPPHIVGAPVIA